MMPPALFASRSFIGLTLLTLLLYGALCALLVLIPYVLIEAAGYSGTGAGTALLPLPVVLSVTSPMMGRLAGRFGSRLPLTLGSLIQYIGEKQRYVADGHRQGHRGGEFRRATI